MSNTFSDHSQIQVVSSFLDLIESHFQGLKNAICWHRNLIGDFKEIVSKLELRQNITEVTISDLQYLDLSNEGDLARELIIDDMQRLMSLGASPSLNLIKNYPRDEELDFISTDVYSFHVDRSPIATDTFLCTYYGAASEIIANDKVEQKILIPEIRAKLKELHHGVDGEFEQFLEEYYFDLHYQPKVSAIPVNLGRGHLWKLAVDHPTQHALACVHRAPTEKDGEYRLLLIC